MVPGRHIPYQVFTPEDDSVPPQVRRRLGDAPERTVVLRPEENLPPDTRVTVVLQAGAPSAEGPLATVEDQRVTYHTFGPLKIYSSRCISPGYDRNCVEDSTFQITFSNAIQSYYYARIDPTSVTADLISIAPPLPGGTVEVTPWSLHITGPKLANTIYTVRLKPGITDEFGQTFADTQEVSFAVHEVPPGIRLHFPRPMEVLNPLHNGLYPLFARNLSHQRVLLFRIDDTDWQDFLNGPWINWGRFQTLDAFRLTPGSYFRPAEVSALQRFLREDPVLDVNLALGSELEQTSRTWLDLNPYLDDGKGHLLLALPVSEHVQEPVLGASHAVRRWMATWIQATSLALESFRDQDSLVIRATRLATGEPVAGIDLQFMPLGVTTTTDAEGYGVFQGSQLDAIAAHGGAGAFAYMGFWVVARAGQDTAILPIDDYRFQRDRPRLNIRSHVFTDRNLYRPGEQVRVKGWLRAVELFPAGDLTWADDTYTTVLYLLYDGRGTFMGEGTVDLDDHGAFSLAFAVPEDANAGRGRIDFYLGTGGNTGFRGRTPYNRAEPIVHSTRFQIQEFRRPEFEVLVTGKPGPLFQGRQFGVDAKAQYYGGGPVSGAEIRWDIQGGPTHYSPPGWQGFSFGVPNPTGTSHRIESQTAGELDAQGRHRLSVTLADAELSGPHWLHFAATIQDLSQQSHTASDSVLIHPANLYVGVATTSQRGLENQPYRLSLITTDIDGVPIPGKRLKVSGILPAAESASAESLDQQEILTPSCQRVSATEPVHCSLLFRQPGRWIIEVTAEAEEGQTVSTRIERWIAQTTGTRIGQEQ